MFLTNSFLTHQQLYEKAIKEIPKKMKVITVYNLIENYKINGTRRKSHISLLHLVCVDATQ